MESIQINRLDIVNGTISPNDKIDYSILLSSIYDESTLSTKIVKYDTLKKYFEFMKSNEWSKFFIGEHEITSYDIDYIQNFYDKKKLLENVNPNYYNRQILIIQQKLKDMYKTVEFTLLDSFVYRNEQSYIFVDLCWCTERGMRIYVEQVPLINIVGCLETEV